MIPEPTRTRDELLSQPAEPLLRQGEHTLFRTSWEAQAFAIGNLLIKRGFMTRAEWVEVFSQEILRAQAAGDPDRGDTYYGHWMNALDRIVVERGLIDGATLRERQWLWKKAKDNTPHGVAITIENAFGHDCCDHDHDHHHDCDDDHDHGHHHHHHGEPDPSMLLPVGISGAGGD